MNKRMLILSFSARQSGNCANISRYITAFYTAETVQAYVIDSAIFPPCGNCDYECLRPDMLCPNLSAQQQRIMDDICSSDLVYFLIPNHCGGPCANYFAFNERSVGYFQQDVKKLEQYMNIKKRFIVVSNTEGFEEFAMQQTLDAPDIFYLKSQKYQKQSIAGDILESEAAKADLEIFLKAAPCL